MNIFDFFSGYVKLEIRGMRVERFINIIVNEKKCDNFNYMISKDNVIDQKYVIVRRGKKKYYLGIYE